MDTPAETESLARILHQPVSGPEFKCEAVALVVEQGYGYAVFDGSFGPIQIRTTSTAITVPIKDSPSRNAAF